MEPAKLTKLMRGELDWLVMKCLEKDRNRRYETANGFAMDVQRYLADEPVRACPPSALYRFRKFVRRNKRAVAVAATGTAAAAAAVILTVVLLVIHSMRIREEQARTGEEYQRAESALREAKGNLQRADRNLGLALEAMDDMCLKDVENRIFRDRRLSAAERESLQRGLAFYERFAEQNAGHAELQGVMAKANRRAGSLRLQLQDWQEARANFTKAIPVLEQLADDSAGSAEYRRELARCCYGLSLGLMRERRYREAEPNSGRAIALLEKLAAEFPHEPTYRLELGHTLWLLGQANDSGILFSTGRPKEAEQTAREALRVFEALAAEYPKKRFYRQETAFSHGLLSSIFANTGRPGLAVASRRQSVALYAGLVAEVPNSSFYRHAFAYSCRYLGNDLQANQQTPEAEEAYRQALAVYTKLVAESNQERDRWELGYCHEHLGLLRKKAAQLDEAAEHLRAALIVWEKLVADFNKGDFRGHWSGTHRVLADVLFARAREVEKDTKLAPDERQAAAQAYRDKARKVVRDGIINKSLLVSWTNFAEYPEAEALLMESLAQQLKKGGAEISLEASFSMHQYALNYLKSGKYAEAERLFRACLPIREKERPNSWMTTNTRARLGAALLGQKKYAEAEPFLLEGYARLKEREAEIPASERYSLTDAVNWLIELYDAWGQKDKADVWRQKK
jgi:tetratricopeptide (TPR) repeat protein